MQKGKPALQPDDSSDSDDDTTESEESDDESEKQRKKSKKQKNKKKCKTKVEETNTKEMMFLHQRIKDLEAQVVKQTQAIQDTSHALEEKEKEEVQEIKKKFGNTRPIKKKKLKSGYLRLRPEYIAEQKKLKAWKEANKRRRKESDDEDWQAKPKHKKCNSKAISASKSKNDFEALKKSIQADSESDMEDSVVSSKVEY